jgi:two-component system, sensor histidine kinase YesM
MNRKSKSINRRIVITFLLIMAVMSSSFLYSNFMKNNIVEQYNISMRTNIKFSDLSVDFNNSWVNFDSYIKSHDTNTYEKFTESNRKIESLLKELEVYAEQDKNSSIYFRTLKNMFELYKEQTSSVIAKEKLDIETYEQYVRLGRMNFYMSQHSRNLTSAYLQFTDSYYSNILDKYKVIDTNLYLLLVFAIFTCAFLIWAVNHGVFSTINKISVSVKLLSNSNWDIPDIEEQPYKELNNFTKTFNHMKNSIREYINQLNQKAEIEKNYHLERIKSAEKDKLIKDTQLKTLQMQVNPHFLFNNLNTVSRMAMFEEADKTVDLIGALSKILRYNLVSIDKLVKLSEEIESVKAYILIQKTKYEDRVCFEFNIDKEIEDIKIPPMIIQLLVENSIIHGLTGLDRDGIIKVEGLKDGNFAIITVEDNGVGMTEADEKIRENKTTTGLGLANIRRRLELYYSRQDLLTIESSLGKGTKVCITIPLKDGEDIDESINS